ncbi:FadD3 family acyl-CoA ligase [Streptomyces sp. NPDC051133]|uniref:FadD3 family acyl-CoA ligase n=1 Tax=Streptomyces sp. NPDC051133 TaxID=3155521 RepID=UPI00343809E3
MTSVFHDHAGAQPLAAPATLARLADYAADAYGPEEALVDGEVRWTFSRLRDEVHAAARAALAQGVGPGDRVAVWAPNTRYWIAAVLGAVSVGAVLVPLNTRYKAAEAADLIRRSGARLLFTERGFLGIDYVEMLRESGEDLGMLGGTVVLRGEPAEGTLGWADYLAAGRRVAEAERAARTAAVRPDDLADVLFTSGTTGRSKGVMSTHGQTLRVFGEWSRVVTLRAGDRYLLVNPFFHVFGYKAGVVACLLRGVTMIPEEVFDLEGILPRLATERVSVLMATPTVLHSLLDHPRRAVHDLAGLRLVGLGGSGVGPQLIERIRAELGIPDVFSAYGLTESTGVVSVCPPDADAESVATTAGPALPGTQVRVAGADGTPLPPGEPGEVLVRGYNVMRGYLDDPRATARTVDADGWLHTGDVGVLDERGYLSITDRLKDMYIVGGFNAYPAEVENVLRGHAQIADVAVVGAPDDRLGEVGVAFYTPAPGADPDPAELTVWARERLANFKVPRRFHVVPALPRNAGGKILKGELRRAAREGGSGPGSRGGRLT